MLGANLADHGIAVGIHRIKHIRRKLGLRCRQKQKLKAATNVRHSLPIVPNLPDRQFAVMTPNQAWVTDITCIATDEGWLDLAGIKDLFNGALLSYALNNRMIQNLVMQALFRAVVAKRPGKGLIHHSDRSYQYELLQQFGMQASMSRKDSLPGQSTNGSCRGSLKSELVHHCRFATREQARSEIAEYIEIFSNRIRKQARLGHLSPAAFCHQQYYVKQMAA